MKNITTFKTAADLKAAGFPQPEPEAGQFWYAPFMGSIYGRFPIYFIVRANANIRFLSHEVSENELGHVGELTPTSFTDACVFAPSAPDILAELFPERKCVSFGAMDLLAMALDPEAAALAYIEIKKQ